MDRLFLDANVLFSAAYRAEAGVQRLWRLESAELVSSDYAIEEARRNLIDAEQRGRLDVLLQSITCVPSAVLDPEVGADVALPEKDVPILGAAVAAGATHLITGDQRDFGRYFGSAVLGVRIMPPATYLEGRGDP